MSATTSCTTTEFDYQYRPVLPFFLLPVHFAVLIRHTSMEPQKVENTGMVFRRALLSSDLQHLELSSRLKSKDRHPISNGAYCEMYYGSLFLNTSERERVEVNVAIKVLRFHLQDKDMKRVSELSVLEFDIYHWQHVHVQRLHFS